MQDCLSDGALTGAQPLTISCVFRCSSPLPKMKSYLKLLAALGVASFALSITAFAAEAAPAAAASSASPTGTWKWTQPGRNGGQGFEQTLKLELKDGKLTGTILGMQGPQGQMPDVAIGDASYKDGAVAFTVTREFNGNTFVSKYEAKLEGDTLKGSVERPGRDGGAPMKRDWTATRAK